MALGDETTIIEHQSYAVELLASATTVNGVPANGGGIEINKLNRFRRLPDQVRIGIKSTAGSGTMTATVRVWFRFGSTIGWFVGKPIIASSAAPHTAVAIPETGTDTIAYTEVVECPVGADRMYLEIVAIAGTLTAVTGYVFVGRSYYS